jgi:hypothetical protein
LKNMEKISYFKKNIGIIFIILVSFIVYCHGFSKDTSDRYFHDGINFIENALRMGAADFKYYGYGHGAFFSMALFFAYGVLFLFEIIFGLIGSKQEFFFQYIANPKLMFLTAHLVVILFGIIPVVLTYLIGKKLFNDKVGLIASLLVSLSFTNIQMSALIKEDNLALTMLLFGGYFAANILTSNAKPLKSQYILAGFFVGLAAAAKYTFIIGYVFIIAAHLLKNRENIKRNYAPYSIISLVFGFLCGNPFVIKEWHSFIKGFLNLGPSYYSSSFGNNFNQIIFFYSAYLGVIFCLCVLLGAAFALIKDAKKTIFILSYPAALIMVFLNFSITSYYILPTIPFFSISAAYLIWYIFKSIKNNLFCNLCCILLGFLVICPSFINGLKFKTIMTAPDTRTLAKAWIEKNIEKDATVLTEGAVGDVLIFSPQLNSNIETLNREKEKVVSEGGAGRLYDRRIKWVRENPGEVYFNIYKVAAIDTALLNETRPKIVIMTGIYDGGSPKDINERRGVKRIVEQDYRLIKLFSAYPDFSRLFPMISKKDLLEIKNMKLTGSGKPILSGYNIYIYKKKI